ncbi:zf-DHHC-domain-containing protein [Wallemia mellicola]|uniref:Palmitoyltransferase n=1 Tax=Wallemia mellicola TaxID=1708541 RepID=A0A4T0LDH7_9BASI|nr:hypothetical protein E3Q24_04169 [Wallemia mellicola]TIB94157.1 zf-DHHC-domain-containing protein [Wallemia mellicola]TIB99262.1 zf-DHHC-domain-containing protein [Wallemia mellicola]TIC11564.1 zf-DHHC-domain-containing protein [Wallemia mellicola]TIC21659.1 zf-DHHC-domain-containing protein [Wallemia mellicola]
MDKTRDNKSSATNTCGRIWWVPFQCSFTLFITLFVSLSYSSRSFLYPGKNLTRDSLFAFLIFLNYYLCLSTDPGGVPTYYRQEPISLRDNVLEMKSNSDNARFCRSCQVYKPPRAHHCSRSNRCILRMDHYCPWMNNCIGFYNYGHFIRFLIFVDIGCLFHFYLLTKRVLNPIPPPDNTETLIIVLNYISCIFVLLVVGSFSVYHIYSTATNTTTIESWEKDKVNNLVNRGKIRDIKFPYRLSVYENICSVLGDRPILWLLPQRMKGDGLSFTVAADTGKWVDVHSRGRSIIREPKSRRRRHHIAHAALHFEDGSPVDTNISPDERKRGRKFENETLEFEKRLLELA